MTHKRYPHDHIYDGNAYTDCVGCMGPRECAHEVVVASAYEFCRICGRVWDDEFPGAEYMGSEQIADELDKVRATAPTGSDPQGGQSA